MIMMEPTGTIYYCCVYHRAEVSNIRPGDHYRPGKESILASLDVFKVKKRINLDGKIMTSNPRHTQ